MQQIRVLAVAPYEGMAESIMSVAQERNDIEMTVKIGDLNTGKEIALESAHKNYLIQRRNCRTDSFHNRSSCCRYSYFWF